MASTWGAHPYKDKNISSEATDSHNRVRLLWSSPLQGPHFWRPVQSAAPADDTHPGAGVPFMAPSPVDDTIRCRGPIYGPAPADDTHVRDTRKDRQIMFMRYIRWILPLLVLTLIVAIMAITMITGASAAGAEHHMVPHSFMPW